MNRLLGRMKKFIGNNGGMSIVTVVVAIGFVAILISIILMSSVINFKMKSMNSYSKDSFYSAEQVLDEINVGLQQIASDALSSAYTSVLQTYDAEDMSAEDKNAYVKAKYYEYVWDAIGYDSAHKTYLIENPDASAPKQGLYGMLRPSTKWHDGAGDMNKEYGAFLRSAQNTKGTSGEAIGKLTNYENKGIVLEDLVVYYKDVNGFISEIQTDIRIAYPELSFSNSNMPDVSTYCFITDGGYEEKASSPVTTVVCGDTYAYSINTRNVTMENTDTELGHDLHIVARDLDLYKGKFITNEHSTLWCDGIIAKSADVELDGYTYVKDDMDLKGRSTSATLKGYYYGYGNGDADASDLNEIIPETSSSILINGSNVSVDMSEAKGVSVAGHAFVSAYTKNTKAGEEDISTLNKDKNDINIFTGESIAVKSNQIMYLIPPECIGVNKETGVSFGSNPLTSEDYEKLTDAATKNDYVEVDPTVTVGKLAGPIADYIAYKGTEPDFEKVFVRSTSNNKQTLVYYYMKFKDENAANNYFARYYALNKEYLDQYLDNYLNVLKIPTTGNTNLRLKLAGGFIAGDKINGYENEGYVIEDGMKKFEVDNLRYFNQFDGYCTKLTPDIESLATVAGIEIFSESEVDESGNKKARTSGVVFDNIIDEDMLKTLGGIGIFKDGEGKDAVQFIYRADKDVMVNANTDCSLIVANCGVNVGADYKGTIIAKGKIVSTVPGRKYTADIKRVEECMLLTQTASDGIEYRVADVFKDCDEIKIKAITEDEGDGTIAVSDLIVMENWIKR